MCPPIAIYFDENANPERFVHSPERIAYSNYQDHLPGKILQTPLNPTSNDDDNINLHYSPTASSANSSHQQSPQLVNVYSNEIPTILEGHLDRMTPLSSKNPPPLESYQTLQHSSRLFSNRLAISNSRLWWKNVKMNIFIFALVVTLVLLIIFGVVGQLS